MAIGNKKGMKEEMKTREIWKEEGRESEREGNVKGVKGKWGGRE